MDGLKETVLFIDSVCPRPYDPSNISVPGGVGGTEQTMVTLAEGMAGLGMFNVVVEQHNRSEEYKSKATWSKLGTCKDAKWVIVLRNPYPMLAARTRFPNAKIYLYSHDLASPHLGDAYSRGVFKESGCVANVCVSQWHKTQTLELLKQYGFCGEFRTKYIYNPLDEYVTYQKTEYDNNKLMWLASPHKGLTRAYELFKHLVRINPDFRLYVTNPGYLENLDTDDTTIKEKTIALGTLSHLDAISHLRSSLCLFYPNTVFPETFGKILAEANAVGTPVLTSNLGAAPEVLDSHPEQRLDCKDDEAVLRRVMKWHEGARPFVRGNAAFNLSRVLKEWVKLFKELR